MKKKTKPRKKGEIAKEILRYTAIAGGITLCFTAPGAAPFLGVLLCRDANERRRYLRSLLTLNRRGMLRIINDEQHGNTIALTKTGKRESERISFWSLSIDRPKKWDGLWRIVIFDVPHNRRAARSVFRTRLRELGFSPYQKSVFVFPFPCEKEIRYLADYLDMSRCIRYVEAHTVDDEDQLIKEFDLSK